MSYYDEPFDTGEIDPYAMDQQMMIDYLVANGAGAGMIPDYQPSGRPLTVANQTSAMNANRSALFDTAFQGLGGPQAFAPGAFEPTVSTSIKQTPELQQVYGYLRAPQSMEGIMAQEMMIGGTPATAQRALQQLLTATPEEVAAVFAGYDQFFGRAPSVSAADAERIQTNLLMELPQRPVEYGMPAPERTIENVNWDADENSVTAQARLIGELQAEIPRVGPSAPQWGVDPATGQPVQISAGGELQWGTDESGAPVLMETTVTESEAAQTFSDLGLPNPAEEYTAESFMTPDQIAMQQAYGEMENPIAALKQAWMDPALAPTNASPQGPAGVPAAPGWGGPGTQGSPEEAQTGWNTGLGEILGDQGFTWRDPVETTATLGGNQLADVMFQNPSGDTSGIWGSFTRQGLWDVLTGNEAGDERTMRERIEQGDALGPMVPPPTNATPGIGAGSGGPFSINVAPSPAPPPGPSPTGPSGNPVAEALDLFVRGGQTGPAYAQPGAQPANQPGGPGFQQGATQATVDAMLAQLLPGNQQRSTDLPAHAQQGAQPANQPGGPAHLEAIETGERRAAQRQEDEQNAQVLGGSTDRTGRRRRPTRTGEQARQYRQAFEAWDLATDQQQQARQAAHTYESGQAIGQAWRMQQQGVRPLDQALMARRLVLMNAGMPQGI